MSHPTFRAVVLSLLLLVGLAASATAQEATPVTDSVIVYPPDALVADASLGEWYARSLRWAVSFPADEQPSLEDTNGSRCGYGQSAPVFFLPVFFSLEAQGAVTCIVPAGLSLLVTVMGFNCTMDQPAAPDEEVLRGCAEEMADQITDVSLAVNGQEVTDIEQYRVTTPVFTISLPKDNVFNAPAGVVASMASGYNVMLAPLPEGEYEIIPAWTVADGEETGPSQITIRVIVQGPQVLAPEATPGAGTPEVATPTA